MKYILSTLVLLCIPISALAWAVSISTDNTQYNIDDTISLSIEIESDNSGNAQVVVWNLEQNFTIVGQSQSNQTQILNGEAQSKIFITLNLLAHTAGSYTLWPISIVFGDGESIFSEAIDIKISGERILINPNIKTSTQSSGSTVVPQDLSKIELWNTTDSSPKDILWVDGEVMDDIYDIKQNLLPRFYTFWSILIAFIGTLAIYTLIQFSPSGEKWGPKKKNIKQKKIHYWKEIQKIRSNDIEKSKDIFYGKLGNLFREYLDAEVQYGLSGKSLSEVQAILPKKLLGVYTQLYYPAYDNRVDEQKSRTQILNTLEQIMIKK